MAYKNVLKEQQEKLEERKLELKEKYKNGILAIMNSEDFYNMCVKSSQYFIRKYSLTNALLINFQNQSATYVMGYNQWEEYGRQVAKGSKALGIFGPVMAVNGAKGISYFGMIDSILQKKLSKSNEQVVDIGSILKFTLSKNQLYGLREGKDIILSNVSKDEMRRFVERNVVNKKVDHYRILNVFDIGSTIAPEFLWIKNTSNFKKEDMVLDNNGKPIKNSKGAYKIRNTEERKKLYEAKYTDLEDEENIQTGLTDEKLNLLYDVLKEVSKKENVNVSEEKIKDGSLGYYNRSSKEIKIKEDMTIVNKVSVLFHEMAHSHLHKDLKEMEVILEDDNQEKIVVTKNIREVQAEGVACMVASQFGINTEHKSFDYLAGWCSDANLNELEKSFNIMWKEGKSFIDKVDEILKQKNLDMNLNSINIEENKKSKQISKKKNTSKSCSI